MTDLRAQVVEAMAQAIRDADDARTDDIGVIRPPGWETFDLHAGAALDAALGALGENAEEWKRVSIIEANRRYSYFPSDNYGFVGFMLAVLRP